MPLLGPRGSSSASYGDLPAVTLSTAQKDWTTIPRSRLFTFEKLRSRSSCGGVNGEGVNGEGVNGEGVNGEGVNGGN